VLYYLSHTPSPFFFFLLVIFFRQSYDFAQGWPQTTSLLCMASYIAS
jgi:hypothetical protein